MSSEANFWDMVQDKLSPFGALIRIENRIGGSEGLPDVLYGLKRKPFMATATGWIELKECEWPKRAGTRFCIPSLTLEQVLFAEKWNRIAGRVHLMAQVSKDYLIWSPIHIRPIFEHRYTSSEAIAAASVRWRQQAPWPLAEILDELAGYENVKR